MRKFLLLAAAVMVVAPPAHSQQPLPEPLPQRGPPPSEGQRPRRHLFVSPSGEPFRGRDGLAAWFAQADADHDAALAPAEFQADAERAFRLYDSDGSGVLDGLEIQAYERERVPEITELAFGGDAPGGRGGRRGRGPRRGGGGDGERSEPRAGKPPGDGDAPFRGAGSTGAARFSLLNEPEPLLAADEDIDGKVTRAEWSRAAVRRFALLDRDHAGRLTLAGLRTSAAKHRG
ncbi:hypothetical protein LJR225_003839 [Phenylobacterium sp. LjRoot225]|uniref:hypothetical protein n=1 Tax=Phenylobacterium sp. LjRoot225 TaxID=3342285 RepID=UPI003ECFEA3D